MPNFDPGYVAEPFLSLCDSVPLAAFPSTKFRIEWGPMFHRGRLDGSARVLVIGQDPAAHETYIRRILVGEAGSRVQGLLAKLGITKSYVMINTFVYSVYGSSASDTAAIAAYRNKWFDAVLLGKGIEAVIALGSAANKAWTTWLKSHPAFGVPFQHITHPTEPESAANGDATKLAAETKKLLANWNTALTALNGVITHTDGAPSGAAYGTTWKASERPPVPMFDLPAGLPAWMQSDGWATRAGANAADKRRNLTLTIPTGVI